MCYCSSVVVVHTAPKFKWIIFSLSLCAQQCVLWVCGFSTIAQQHNNGNRKLNTYSICGGKRESESFKRKRHCSHIRENNTIFILDLRNTQQSCQFKCGFLNCMANPTSKILRQQQDWEKIEWKRNTLFELMEFSALKIRSTQNCLKRNN